MIRFLLAISFLFATTTNAAETPKKAKSNRAVANVSYDAKACIRNGDAIDTKDGGLTRSCKATGQSGYQVFFSECSDFNNHTGELEAVSGGCQLMNDDNGKSKATLVGSFSGVSVDHPGWFCQYTNLSPADIIQVTSTCK